VGAGVGGDITVGAVGVGANVGAVGTVSASVGVVIAAVGAVGASVGVSVGAVGANDVTVGAMVGVGVAEDAVGDGVPEDDGTGQVVCFVPPKPPPLPPAPPKHTFADVPARQLKATWV